MARLVVMSSLSSSMSSQMAPVSLLVPFTNISTVHGVGTALNRANLSGQSVPGRGVRFRRLRAGPS
jgi:hypothetical protein